MRIAMAPGGKLEHILLVQSRSTFSIVQLAEPSALSAAPSSSHSAHSKLATKVAGLRQIEFSVKVNSKNNSEKRHTHRTRLNQVCGRNQG